MYGSVPWVKLQMDMCIVHSDERFGCLIETMQRESRLRVYEFEGISLVCGQTKH